jgi:hypothetical protein
MVIVLTAKQEIARVIIILIKTICKNSRKEITMKRDPLVLGGAGRRKGKDE